MGGGGGGGGEGGGVNSVQCAAKDYHKAQHFVQNRKSLANAQKKKKNRSKSGHNTFGHDLTG